MRAAESKEQENQRLIWVKNTHICIGIITVITQSSNHLLLKLYVYKDPEHIPTNDHIFMPPPPLLTTFIYSPNIHLNLLLSLPRSSCCIAFILDFWTFLALLHLGWR